MALTIFNSLTGRKEELVPLEPGKVRMYVCGPTVYDLSHIGHARAYVVYDVVVRWLRALGLEVTYVRNYTDVDDKIIKRAAERGESPFALAERYIREFIADMEALGVARADIEPKVTEHMPEIVALIERLVAVGAAYVSEGDVYFAVRKFPGYGKLSKRNLDDLKSGARVEPGEKKEDPLDFALWKAAKPGEPSWPSPWGAGRPGWHIECSAMSEKYLGETFDLHTGGKDLLFPHHENEIAQSEAASGKPFARHWMHHGFVTIDEEKMSKSLGNFFTVRDLLARYDGESLRAFVLGTHYRNPIDFSDFALAQSDRRVEYWYETLLKVKKRLAEVDPKMLGMDVSQWPHEFAPAAVKAFEGAFAEAMNDDFNTAQAMGLMSDVFAWMNEVAERPRGDPATRTMQIATLRDIQGKLLSAGKVLGLFQRPPAEALDERRKHAARAGGLDPSWADQLIAERDAARSNKDFARADVVRGDLAAVGVEVMDTPRGSTWRKTEPPRRALRQLFSELELRTLLARDEGQFLEFKSLWDRSEGSPRTLKRDIVRDSIAKHVAAFANADGGTLVLGVDDDGTPSGHGYPEEAVAQFLATPEARLRPEVRVDTQRAELDGKELLIFNVPATPLAVMVVGQGFPYRIGDKVISEPQEVVNERKQAYRRVGYERLIRHEASTDDLDMELVQALLPRLIHKDRSALEFLTESGLVLEKSGRPAVTNAALLLFGRPPMAQWHPRAGIRFFRVAGTARRHGPDRNVSQLARLEIPIAGLLPEAHRFASSQIRRSEKLHNLFFREVPEYPEFAWQEALVNAVAHRDYSDYGREIEVWFYDDRMEVESPGDLVPPVTLERLRSGKRAHATRNPLIVRVLVEAEMMREEGEGIQRMFNEMEKSLLRHPEFRVENSTFSLTLRNQPVFEGPSPEWRDLIGGLRLTTAQQRVLLAHPDGFTNEDYRSLNGLDRDQAYREIHELVERGIVSPPDLVGKGASYRLSPEFQERAWLEKRITGVLAYLATHGFLKNADYRELFGVTRETARRELGLLVKRGELRMEGVRRGARYLAGPALGKGPGVAP